MQLGDHYTSWNILFFAGRKFIEMKKKAVI